MIVHTDEQSVTMEAHGVRLLRYVHDPDPEPTESPKPYLHPLRTLADDVVTVYRPHDHRWHKGLQMTASHLSGDNFWGGGTYVHESRGYVQLDNNGSIRHDSLDVKDGSLSGRLSWRSGRGELWAEERREIAVRHVAPENGSWELEWHSAITGLRAEPLRFGSPTTHGRPQAGYSGLFWRGPRSFTGGAVIGPDGLAGEEMMGRQARWLAFHGVHDEVDRSSTLVFVPEPGPVSHWFVRSGEFAAVNPSWAFHEEFELACGETLDRRYRVVVATGAWTADRIESYLRDRPW
ncbi:PmoA family protein [Streptosporangium amethystogenes]|uniref:DUF6807 domain-containing protein n=1 Tax=Streptosporangium amethystogenes TaxID=2002 RepID=UPI0004CA5EB0|nr:PmoA family protein [Streptosporangium amethystogenes]